MKKSLIAAAMLLALGTNVFAEGTGHDAPHVTLETAEWFDAPLPGVQLAHAWGEDATGATYLIKFDPGVELPMHTHTNDYWGLTIQGNWVHIHEDGSETATQPGDYGLTPGGKPHADRCESADPCIGLLSFSGPIDALPAQ